MADITVTPASVLKGTNATTETGIAGEAIDAGEVVYKKAADGKFWLSDANDATVAVNAAYGIALNSAAANQPVVVQTRGSITIGATITAGTIYVLSATAGGIAPAADLTTGWSRTILGVASSTTVIDLSIVNTGIIG